MARHRIQLDLSDNDYAALQSITDGRTLSDVFRQALRLETYLARKKDQGATLVIKEDGTEKELVRL